MADEHHNDEQLLTAEFKDGELEIVEVSSYDKELKQEHGASVSTESSEFIQVLDGVRDKNNMVVDLLNFTLVRGEDGVNTYRLVGHSEGDSSGSEATVTCMLSNEGDGDEQETEEYVMVEGSDGPLVLLQSTLQQTQPVERPPVKVHQKKAPVTPTEILEKVKAYQKAKALMASQSKRRGNGPRGPKAALPTPQEMLSSPGFKLFLYSCKLCSFKCNAIKQLTAHKAIEHFGAQGGRYRSGRAAASTLQCARCPFRATTHSQLVKHAQENHVEAVTTRIYLDSAEVEAADVLVCGACGFESSSRDVFKKHIEEEHGATTC